MHFLFLGEEIKPSGDETLNWIFLTEFSFALELPDKNRGIKFNPYCIGIADAVKFSQQLYGSHIQSIAFLNQIHIDSTPCLSTVFGELDKERTVISDLLFIVFEEPNFDEFIRGREDSKASIPVLSQALYLKEES